MSDLPRVVVVAGHLSAVRGGQERTLDETLAALRTAGVRTTLLAAGSTQAPELERLPYSGPTRAARMRGLLAAAESALATRHRGALVHALVPVRGAHAYMPMGGLYLEAFARNLASRPAGIARLVASAGASLDGLRRLLVAREAELLGAPDGPVLLALSGYVAEQGRRHFGLAQTRISVVRNGIDLAFLSPGPTAPTRATLGIGAHSVVFLAAAFNARLKGIPELVAAAERVRRTADVAVLVAGGRGPRRWEGACLHLGVVASIADFLALTDVVVHPTFYDSSGRVVLEGLAAGKPVITTRWAGAAEELTDDGVVLEDPADVGALAAALQAMLDPERRAACAAVARTKRPRIALERHLADLLRVLGEIARARGLSG